MNVLIITNTIKPDSGWGRYSLGVVNELSRRGINHTVIDEDFLLPNNSYISFFKNCLRVRKKAKDFTVVHAFDGWPYAIYGFFAVLGTSKKLLINAVGTYSVAPLKKPIKGILLKRAYVRAQKIFSISNFITKKILEQVRLTNITTVYLGPSELPEPTKEDIANFRHTFSLPEAHPFLLTVGAIKDRKGQYDTVQAVVLLKKIYPDVLYVMVGSDKDTTYVQKIKNVVAAHSLENNVRIISNITTDHELACSYACSDMFLLNSHQTVEDHLEGFGLVLLEAASFSKPVIASRESGTSEAMKNEYNGLVSEENNPEDIARAVTGVLKRYDEFSKNSKLFVREFSWKNTVDQYVKWYTSEQ